MEHDYLDWPFFDQHHAELARALDCWAAANLGDAQAGDHGDDVDAICRALVKRLGRDDWLRHAVAGVTYGGAGQAIDTRALCLVRETLARHAALADFAFAMQGLGSGAISLFGSEAQKRTWLPRVARGQAIAAFALSEPQAGSDVAALRCGARRDGDGWVLDGEKTWVSNGGIADFYILFAHSGAGAGAGAGTARARRGGPRPSDGISAFIVDAATPGLEVAERIHTMAPHPMARLRLHDCRVPAGCLLGEEGQGFKVAMTTLDVFRTSVAAAALGFARRALAEALAHATARPMFGRKLADFQLTQAKLAQMALDIDAAALLTYRAAWLRDAGGRVTQAAAMAKLAATESAQRVIDAALQLLGAGGVQRGATVERLYRNVRALRIHEGASEVQLMIIARELLAAPV